MKIYKVRHSETGKYLVTAYSSPPQWSKSGKTFVKYDTAIQHINHIQTKDYETEITLSDFMGQSVFDYNTHREPNKDAPLLILEE